MGVARRRPSRAAQRLLQGNLGRHLGPSLPMPWKRAARRRRVVRQREPKRRRSITRQRVHNATWLIISTERQEGRVTAELAGLLSPIAQRTPSDARRQSAASPSHTGRGRSMRACFPEPDTQSNHSLAGLATVRPMDRLLFDFGAVSPDPKSKPPHAAPLVLATPAT